MPVSATPTTPGAGVPRYGTPASRWKCWSSSALADGTVVTLPWLQGRGGRELPTEARPAWDLARTVAACGLRLPFQFSIPEILDRAIEELEAECSRLAVQGEPLAGRGADLDLDENCQTLLAGYELRYTYRRP